MANASIIGFISKDHIEKLKKILKDRFIDVRDFPDGVPVAWQDKQLKLTGPHEPLCDGNFAAFGIRNLEDEAEALEILSKVVPLSQIFHGFIMAPEFWSEGISEKFNGKKSA